MPANAGLQAFTRRSDSRLRGNDKRLRRKKRVAVENAEKDPAR